MEHVRQLGVADTALISKRMDLMLWMILTSLFLQIVDELVEHKNVQEETNETIMKLRLNPSTARSTVVNYRGPHHVGQQYFVPAFRCGN